MHNYHGIKLKLWIVIKCTFKSDWKEKEPLLSLLCAHSSGFLILEFMNLQGT